LPQCNMLWRMAEHNYYYKYYLCEAGLSYYINATKRKYRNGLNATPDIMIIHLFSIKPYIFKNVLRRGKGIVLFTLTKNHIVSTKQSRPNSGTHAGLQII